MKIDKGNVDNTEIRNMLKQINVKYNIQQSSVDKYRDLRGKHGFANQVEPTGKIEGTQYITREKEEEKTPLRVDSNQPDIKPREFNTYDFINQINDDPKDTTPEHTKPKVVPELTPFQPSLQVIEESLPVETPPIYEMAP